MRKGLSGSEITFQCESHWPFSAVYVRKAGEGTAAQGEYCKELGEEVCPQIYDIDMNNNYYHMEILKDPSLKLLPGFFNQAKFLLQKYVWPRALLYQDSSWREKLVEFADSFRCNIRNRLYELYPEIRPQHMIHGDPTLANMMLRIGKTVDLVLIDPIRPINKVPGHREVDLGKMLQSTFGWEQHLGMSLEYDAHRARNDILSQESGLSVDKAYFWCAIHLLRTIPYLQAEGIKADWTWSKIDDLRLRSGWNIGRQRTANT